VPLLISASLRELCDNASYTQQLKTVGYIKSTCGFSINSNKGHAHFTHDSNVAAGIRVCACKNIVMCSDEGQCAHIKH